MKTNKYTAAFLALIAAAAITTSANAATGDIILGIYDTSGTVPTSYEVDLGTFANLSVNETFDLGSSIETLFGSSAPAQLTFSIAGTGHLGGGGLSTKQVAFSTSVGATLPSFTGNNTTPDTALTGELSTFGGGTATTLFSGTSSTGKAYTAKTVDNTTTGSFKNAVSSGNGSYGFVGNSLLSPYTTDSVNFYTLANGSTTPTQVGTFQFSGLGSDHVTLTYSPTAAPEPSAYALGLCAVALFVVLRRRSLVA